MQAVASSRRAVLDALTSVQTAATALDETDTVCLTGRGTAARTSHRKATPLASVAQQRLTVLPGALARYRAALSSLTAASVAVTGAARTALLRAVTAGQAEITAVAAFRATAVGVWPHYRHLEDLEGTWITRAVTPWYRTDNEARDAYIVLVEDSRPALNAARTRLGAAVQAVQAPVRDQSAALTMADRALDAVRTPG